MMPSLIDWAVNARSEEGTCFNPNAILVHLRLLEVEVTRPTRGLGRVLDGARVEGKDP